MSDTEEPYCRLCAEPTPKDQLISIDEIVGIKSKIAMKMQWINIDFSPTNTLPTAICFSCFDLLERTWSFLHNVRNAQVKLLEIYSKKVSDENSSLQDNLKTDIDVEAGKPVNEDWDDFQTKIEVKTEQFDAVEEVILDSNTIADFDSAINVKAEQQSNNKFPNDDSDFNTTDTIADFDSAINVKAEQQSNNEFPNDDSDFNTTDSDVPLQTNAKKKKKKTKKSCVHTGNSDLTHSPLTWDNYMCRCANCDAQCKNITSLQLHSLQIHARCCIFKCSDCDKVVSNYKTFINHARIHNKLLRYCCEFCNVSFKNATSLRKHYNVHISIYLTTCHNCGALFDSPELLEDHLILYTKSYKKRGVKAESETDLKCDQCSKEFKSRSNLQQHKLVHMPRSRDFSCHVCGKMFFTKGTLSTHMMTHDDTKPFKCEFCPMAFRARGNLQSHISLHSGVKPFVCESCGKSFRVKRHLKSHSIVHTDLMPYSCEYCSKTFRFKTRLNLHLRQHTGARPYKCIYCDRDFTNGSNFKKHMKRRHNIDTSKKRYTNIVNDQNNDSAQT